MDSKTIKLIILMSYKKRNYGKQVATIILSKL